jgi:phosphoserine phosphatase RsbU/P
MHVLTSGHEVRRPAPAVGAAKTDIIGRAPFDRKVQVTDHETPQQELLATLFDLGREVTAVLDLDQLLHRIPELIARLVTFNAFAVYLLDADRAELSIAYSVGYPEQTARALRRAVGQGLVGTAVAEGRALLVNDAPSDPRYIEAVPGSKNLLVVPLVRKGRVIGALNLLNDSVAFTAADEAVLTQFGAHVAVALENARLFEELHEQTATLETLTEIAREVASILNLDELLGRIAVLTRRVIDYRTFGIFLLNDATGHLEPKVGLEYGERSAWPKIKIGEGLVGYAALHKETVLVDDVTHDTRYLNVIEDVRSELVIPLLVKDRCLGVFDLESPELKAFNRRHAEILNVLASQAAVAIENARLYEDIRANEVRLERDIELAQRVQEALLPTELPRRLRGVDVAARFASARKVGGDLYDFLSPEPNMLVVAVGDVSGKGVPAALYSAYASELVRSRTLGGRYREMHPGPAGVLTSINTILRQRPLEPYYCALCYALFDFKRRLVTMANSGLPYPVRYSADTCRQIEIAGVPLGTFAGSSYDELTLDLTAGDLFVFCTDGITEANDATSREFGAPRLHKVVHRLRDAPAQAVADGIFGAVEKFRGTTPPSDDMTAVVVKITA